MAVQCHSDQVVCAPEPVDRVPSTKSGDRAGNYARALVDLGGAGIWLVPCD